MQKAFRRFQLRERTSKAHAVVDAAIGPFDTLATYKHYLRCQHRFRLPIEAALARVAWPESFGQWRIEPIGDLIVADMLDLDIEAEPAPAPITFEPADVYGVAYVLEGSNLGAQLLYRRALALDLKPDFGARHLSHQADGIAHWRAFIARLEAAEPFDLERTVAAATETFAAAERAFQSNVYVDG